MDYTLQAGRNFHPFLTGQERMTFIGGHHLVSEHAYRQLSQLGRLTDDFNVSAMDINTVFLSAISHTLLCRPAQQRHLFLRSALAVVIQNQVGCAGHLHLQTDPRYVLCVPAVEPFLVPLAQRIH